MRILLSLLVLFLLGACSSSSAPTHYYLLNPSSSNQVMASVDLAITVGPVQVAEHLQRRGIIDRRSNHELHYSASQLWASALPQQIPAVLRQSLQQQLPNARLSSFTNALPMANNSSHQVMLEILHFDGELGGEVSLMAQWQLYDKQRHKVIAQGNLEQQAATKDSSYQSLVEAHNELLSQLSDLLVKELAKLAGQP